MAQISAKEKEDESRFMTQFWQLIKETYEPEDDHDYWEYFAEQVGIIERTCETEMDRLLMLAYEDYLERRMKWEKESGNGKDKT